MVPEPLSDVLIQSPFRRFYRSFINEVTARNTIQPGIRGDDFEPDLARDGSLAAVDAENGQVAQKIDVPSRPITSTTDGRLSCDKWSV